ncbi:methyltransferase domain-containing protein [Sorangium sp. So ce1078]|uniref:class I SAM-dependent methyltransferase n=1 Tax=Sorangium sp. So ce1078 TaxID=3133329 RepID=UPI003F6212EF
MDAPEISDLLIAYDPDTLARLPVRRSAVVERLRAAGRRGGARIAARLPARGDILDEAAVDALLLRVHAELQRLSEEFDQGERVRSVLAPLLDALRAAGAPRPLRVVDVGCGLGYVVRWLAARGGLGPDVELVGCDYNGALIASARAAARDEGLSCRFHVANAFTLREPATVFMSTGVVHHFRGDALVAFFREQARAGALAFVHFDIKPTHLSPIGAWIFHQARMREPLSRHDGVLSALRAHAGAALLSAARAGAEGLSSALFDGDIGLFPVLRVMHAVVGVRPDLRAPFVERLGPRGRRLGAFS